MNRVRPFLAMLRKEITLFMQRPARLALLLLTPLTFVLVIGQTFGGGGSPTVTVFAVDEDQSRASRQVLDALDDVATLQIKPLAGRAEADLRVGSGEEMAAVVIPAGFGEALLTDGGGRIDVIVDPAREQMAGIVVGQVQAATAPLLIDAEVTRGVARAFAGDLQFGGQSIDLAAGGIDAGEFQKFLTAALKGVVASGVQDAIDSPLVRVQRLAAGDPEQLVVQPSLLDWLAPGYTLFFGFFIMGMMSEALFAERSGGTQRRLLTTPAPRALVLLGKILPYFLVSLAQILLVLGLCTLLFDFDLGRSPAAFLLMAAAAAAAITGLGTLLAALVRSAGQAGSVPDLVTIALAVISGAMFPSIRIGGLEQVTPHYWAIRGVQDVITRNLGVRDVLLEAGVLLGMALLFFAVGVWRFKLD